MNHLTSIGLLCIASVTTTVTNGIDPSDITRIAQLLVSIAVSIIGLFALFSKKKQ